jgi:hypothetical protein
MVRPPIDELSRLLGAIEAKVDLVGKTQAEDRMANASWRTDVRKELGGIRSDITEIKGSVNTVTTDVAEMKPDVADYVQKRAEARGISRLAHLIAALGGGSFALALQWLLKKLGA